MRIVSQLGSSGYRSDSCPSRLSDEPLLRRGLDHVVQLQPGRGQLLRGRLVLALRPPAPASHDQEDDGADDGYEQHAPDNGAHYHGDVAESAGLKFTFVDMSLLTQL